MIPSRPRLPPPPGGSGDGPPAERSRRTALVLVLAAVAVLALLAGAAFWLLGGDPPTEAGLPGAPGGSEGAVAGGDPGAVVEGGATTEGSTAAGAGSADSRAGSGGAGSPEGTWVVQPGPLVFAGYRVQEQVAGIDAERTAVGRTPAVTGTIEIAGPYLAQATFDADLTQLASGDGRRDEQARLALDTAQFPTATFTLGAPLRLPGAPTAGAVVEAEVPGTLTVKGTTQPVTLSVQARWNGDTLDVAGSTELGFAGFGIEAPSAGGLVSIEDTGTLEFVVQLVRSPAG